MRQVAVRYARIFRTAPLQSLRNIGRSISAGFIPPVGVVQPTASAAAMAIVTRRSESRVRVMGSRCSGEKWAVIGFPMSLGGLECCDETPRGAIRLHCNM
jgi:hypothetical protein